MSLNRTVASMNMVGWDDDGIAAAPTPLIRNGQVERFCGSRDTLPILGSAIGTGRAASAVALGCVTAPDADHQPRIRVPHLTVTPAATRATVDDLCRDMSHGIVVLNGSGVTTDPRLATGFLVLSTMSETAAFEVVRGKMVRRLEDNALQFNTLQLWKSLAAVGDASTVRHRAQDYYKGQPEALGWRTTAAPAALFKQVDIIRTALRL
jgi:TldD protein